jgi:hypothetical protein
VPEQKATPSSNLEAELFDLESDLFDDQPETPASKGSWTSALPTVGGMAGSLVGGSKMSPIGMALAGVGGAAGEAFRQVADSVRGDFSNVPDTIGGRLKKIGSEGLTQAGMEGAGRVVGKVVTPVAKTLYGLALRPSKALMRDAGGGKLLAGAKRIVDQGFADNVMPSATGRAGKLVTQSADEATAIAAKSPATVKTARIAQKATDDQAGRAAKQLQNAGITPPTDKVATQIGNLVDSNPPDLAMSELLEMRRGAEGVASPAFKAAKMPGGAGSVPVGSEASIARSISGAAKGTLDDMLGESFKQVNRRTQARMAVKQAVDEAAARPNMLTNLLAGGAGVASSGGDPVEAAKRALMLRVMFSPTALGGTALAIGKAPYAQLFRAAQIAELQQ